MEYQNNISGVNKAKKASVIQSVVFCLAGSVFLILGDSVYAEGPVSSYDEFINGKHSQNLYIPNITRDESVGILGTGLIGGFSGRSGGGVHIEVPAEDIESFITHYCTGSLEGFSHCLDIYNAFK